MSNDVAKNTIQQHTPGPWRVVPPDWAGGGNPWRVAGGDHTIAIVPNHPRELDARLIAAAPELLDAARGIRDWLQGWSGTDTTADLVDHVLRLQVAITLAEGSNQ